MATAVCLVSLYQESNSDSSVVQPMFQSLHRLSFPSFYISIFVSNYVVVTGESVVTFMKLIRLECRGHGSCKR